MERVKTFPQITAHSGTVLHGDGRRTFHVKLQTLVRKLGDDGKYYEWPVLVRRSMGWHDDFLKEEEKIDTLKAAYSEIVATCYAILVTGVINEDLINMSDKEPLYLEWRSHPHTLSEKERIDYLLENHQL